MLDSIKINAWKGLAYPTHIKVNKVSSIDLYDYENKKDFLSVAVYAIEREKNIEFKLTNHVKDCPTRVAKEYPFMGYDVAFPIANFYANKKELCEELGYKICTQTVKNIFKNSCLELMKNLEREYNHK